MKYSPVFYLNKLLQIKKAYISLFPFLFVLLFVNANNSFATSASATWALTSNAASSVSGNVTATTGTLTGVTASSTAFSSDGWSTYGWSSTTTSPNTGQYYQFTVSPSGGNTFTVSSISLYGNLADLCGAYALQIYYSTDGFSTSTELGATSYYLSTGTTNQLVNVSGLSISVPSGSTLTMRIYCGDACSSSYVGSSYWNKINNLIVSGSTTSSNSSPAAPTLYNTSGGLQLAFNNSYTSSNTPVFRVSATDPDGDAVDYHIDIDDDPAFGSVNWSQDFTNSSSHYTSGSTNNLTCSALSGIVDGTTYYVRVKAKDPNGSNSYGTATSTTYSFTYKSASGNTDWFQTTQSQFNEGSFSSSQTNSGGYVELSGGSSTNYGVTTIGASNIAWNNYILLQKVHVTSTCNLQSLSVYFYSLGTNKKFRLALYASDGATSGEAGTLLAITNETTASSSGWQTVSTNTNPALSSGYYYVAVIYPDASTDVSFSSGTNGRGFYSYAYAAFPSTCPSGQNFDGTYDYSLYLTTTSGASSGNIISPLIDYASFYGASAWGSIYYGDVETGGSIVYKVYYDATGSPNIVPDAALAGNSTGFTSSPIDISGLNTSTYSKLYIKAFISYTSASPKLNDWRVSCNYCTAPTTSYTVTGGGSYCSGGSGVAVGLSNSQSGVTYQLYVGASTSGSTVAGTGSAITFGSQTTAGTYTVQSVLSGGYCAATMSGSQTIAVNALPSITTTGTTATACYNAGSQTTTLPYTATTNSPTSYSIAWTGLTAQGSTSFAFSGSGGTMTGVTIPAATAAGTYTGTMAITNGNGCTNTQAISATVLTTTLSTPTANSGSSVGSTSFTASWSSVSGATGYYLDVSTSSGFGSFVGVYNAYSVSGTSQLVSGLTANSTYYYRVRAMNSCTSSSNSSTIAINTAALNVGLYIAGNVVNNGTIDQTSDPNYMIMSGTSKTITGSGIYTQTKLRSSGTVTFDGVIVSGSFLQTLVDASKTLTNNNNRTYINGTFTNNGTTTLNASSVWQNSGNWTNNATVTADASSTVQFVGTAAQTVKSNSSNYGNVVINNTVSPDATHGVILSDALPLNASSVLTFTAGTIITSGNLVIVNNTDANAVTYGGYNSAYNLSWVYGTSISGALRRYMSTSDHGDYVFPVGIANRSNKAVLTNNISTSSLYIDCFFNASPTNPNTSFPTNLVDGTSTYQSVHTDGVWVLTPNSAISGTYNLKLYFNGAFASLPDYKFGILSRPSTSTSGADWTLANMGSVVVLPLSVGYASRTGMSSFSEKGIGVTGTILPVELLNFIASCDNEKVKINWSTASEINNDYFKIEKSRDNNNWDYVTTVAGAGNSNSKIDYSIYDEVPYNETLQGIETSYYRIKQVDFNGDYKYYGPVATSCKEQFIFNAFVNENRNISINFGALNNQYSISLFDNNGKKLIDRNGNSTEELNNVILNTQSLSAGIYILLFKSDKEYETKKIVLN